MHSTLLALVLLASSVTASRSDAETVSSQDAPQAVVDLDATLEAARAAHDLPAIAAGVWSKDALLAEGVAGVRALGSAERATRDDLWHVGSITKSFTSTLTALLVEEGVLRWDDVLADHLDLATGTVYETVPLSALAHHASGMPANPDMRWFAEIRRSKAKIHEQRLATVRALLETEPIAPAGAKYLYSNAGYITLGTVLEEATGKPWEELLRERVLGPLDLRSAGFGAPGTAKEIDQPRGHVGNASGKLSAVPPGPDSDNPAALGPAGTLHLSVHDLGRYGQEHLRGELGESELLPAEAFRFLHRGELGNYGCGWIDQPGAPMSGGRRTIWHNGSNTMWYAVLAFVPEAERVFVVVSNGSIASQTAVQSVLEDLAKRFLPAVEGSDGH